MADLLDKKAIRELEDFVKKEIERIVFNTRRNRAKKAGGHYIEDDTGKLRKSIKQNRNFIKQDKKGFSIDLRVIDYFKYLDDERRDELNWYLTEAIFEDEEIRDKVREVTEKSAKRTMIKIIKDIGKKLK